MNCNPGNSSAIKADSWINKNSNKYSPQINTTPNSFEFWVVIIIFNYQKKRVVIIIIIIIELESWWWCVLMAWVVGRGKTDWQCC